MHGALNAGTLPLDGGERPHLTALIHFQDLVHKVGTGTLNWGGTLSAEAVRKLACDANIIPIVLGSNGEPLDVGRCTRTIRRALVARDGGCAFPGCDRPPVWCDGHHIIFWGNDGPTALNNLVLLCRFHHTVIHQGDWEARIVDGLPEFIPPRHVDPERKPLRNTRPHNIRAA